MKASKKYKYLLICMAIFVIFLILSGIYCMGRKEEKEAVKIGFIMTGGVKETGWNGMHYVGVKAACEELGAELCIKENVEEFSGQCKKAIEELADEGAKMIILSSYRYTEEVRDVIEKYKDIAFYANSTEYHDDNLSTYFVRMYQARYLSGILAGLQTESNHIGYVAAMNNNEVNRGINAFTLGVRQVNPDAVVTVAWTDSWDDKEKETDMANKLIEEVGVDVITYHQNQTNVILAAEQAGIKSIGYNAVKENTSEKMLTAIVCDWEKIYRIIIKDFLQGNGNISKHSWIGIEEEVINLTTYSKIVTEEQKEQIELAKEKILFGKDVFSGIIYDTAGNIMCEEEEIISDEMLLEHSDWFVEGVEFYEE